MMADAEAGQVSAIIFDPVKPGQHILVVGAMVAGMAVSAGSVGNYALGVFIKDLASEYDWTRGQAAAGVSLFMLGLSAGIPFFGLLVDRWGPRYPALISVGLFATALALMGLIANQPMFLLLSATMGFVAGGTTAVPYSVAVSAHFDKRRGLALGVGSAGVGLGGVFLPRYAGYLAQGYGWQAGFVGLALLVPLIAVPAILLGLDARPPIKLRDAARTETGVGLPFYRLRAFWLIAGSTFLISASIGSVQVHGISLLTDGGMSRPDAVGIIGAMASASIVGRILCGFLMDRFWAPLVSASFFLLAASGMAAILLSGVSAPVWIGFVLLGLTAGAEADVVIYLTTRYLSVERRGRYTGLMIAIFTIANAVGVALLGKAFDLSGNYTGGVLTCLTGAILAAIIVTRLGPYPHRVEGEYVSASHQPDQVQ